MSNESCQKCYGLIKIIDDNKKSYRIMRKQVIILSMTMLVMGIPGYALGQLSEITLSNPTIVDMKGHQKNDLYVGTPIGFSSIIENHGTGEKRFTYVVRVLDQNNQIQSRSSMSVNISPNQSLTVAESWIPQKAGMYSVQTFLLNGNLMSSQLTDIINTNIVVK